MSGSLIFHGSREALPEELQGILDPKRPVPVSLRDRYFPRTPTALNMLKLLMGLYLIAAVLAVCMALTIRHENEAYAIAMLALGVVLFTWAMWRSHRHKAAGGHTNHQGTFVLEEGLLLWNGRQADFLPRERLLRFETDAQEGEYKQAFLYPVVQTDTEEEQVYRDWGFPTVGLTARIHEAMLEDYRNTGSFSLDDYLHAGRSAG